MVTVLFADIVGSTALIEGADAEAATNLLAPAVALMTASVRRYGGTISHRAGDGIMAVFGVPRVEEDHASRGCHAAFELQTEIESYTAQSRTKSPLRVRIGLASGRVLVSQVEDAAGHVVTYEVTGPVVHLASRIETSAAPGTVNISQATCWLVRDRFEFLALGPTMLKGFTRPQHLFRLLGPRARERQNIPEQNVLPVAAHAPLVGRQNEVAAVGRFFARLAETGTGGLLLVQGDAGIGKTRLLEEVRPLLPPSVLYLEGHALSFGQRLSYWPFIAMLKPFLGVSEAGNPDTIWEKLESKAGELFPSERDEILPYLATLLGMEVPSPFSERVRYLDGETLARQVLRAGYLLFERLAEDGPVILVIDDAHWLDGSSATLVEHLLSITTELPLLICALGRSGEAATGRLHELGSSVLSPAGAFADLALQSLTVAESQTLVSALLGNAAGGIGRIRDQVLYRAAGNPFYLEEIIRTLIDTRSIVRDPQGVWSVSQLQEITIPDTVQGVIMARIDRLDERLKDVLGIAAVIGRRFFYRVLHAITEQRQELDERLDRLKAAELIDNQELLPEITYIFRHALVQESVYESLLIERRRLLHARVAAQIEALFPSTSQEFASVLALHYARARQWEKALHYLLEAAEQATRMAADDEALLHYEEALETLARAQEVSWDRAQHANVERRLAEIYLRRGDPDRARQHLDAALARFGDSLPTDLSGVRNATIVEAARHLIKRVIPGPRSVVPSAWGNADSEIYGSLYELMCWMFLFSSHDYLLLSILKLVNRSHKIQKKELIAKYTGVLGYVLDALGAHGIAASYHRRAVDGAEASGHLPAIGLTNDTMAIHLFFKGKWVESEQCFNRSREYTRRAGDLHAWSSATIMRCELLCELGRFEQVLSDADEMTALGREAAFAPATRWAGVARGKALRRLGLPLEAKTCLEESIELSTRARDHLNLASARGELGQSLLDADRIEEAMAVLREGYDAARVQKVRGHTMVWLRIGLAQGAVNVAEHAPGTVGWAEVNRACRAAIAIGRRFRLGLVPALRTRGTLEWLRGHKAQARHFWQLAMQDAEDLGAKFEQALCLLEAGTRLGDGAKRDAALEMLAAMGVRQISTPTDARLFDDHAGEPFL